MKSLTPYLWALMLTMFASTAFAASCDDVIYRIWQDGESFFYDHGSDVPLEVGEEAHFYLHYRSQSPSPYSTSAEIGYPSSVGLKGPAPQSVLQTLDMQAQSADDRRDGRIILRAKKPGTTSLGYRMTALRDPGDLDLVPQACRTGTVKFKARRDDDDVARDDDDDDGGSPVAPSYDAAEQLVANLYQGLLRRDSATDLPDEHVEIARRRGQDGLADLAVGILKSEEFRNNAFERTVANHRELTSRSKPREILEALLADIYIALYGSRSSVDERVHQRHFEDLDICMSTFSRRDEACQRLGRSLIQDGQYARHHAADLQRLRDTTNRRVVGRRIID